MTPGAVEVLERAEQRVRLERDAAVDLDVAADRVVAPVARRHEPGLEQVAAHAVTGRLRSLSRHARHARLREERPRAPLRAEVRADDEVRALRTNDMEIAVREHRLWRDAERRPSDLGDADRRRRIGDVPDPHLEIRAVLARGNFRHGEQHAVVECDDRGAALRRRVGAGQQRARGLRHVREAGQRGPALRARAIRSDGRPQCRDHDPSPRHAPVPRDPGGF